MALTKEHIFTLTCLKEIGIKGVGPKKVLSIGNTIKERNVSIESLEDLASFMKTMKERAINSVKL